MITGDDVYRVVSAMVPLYVAAAAGYGCVRWGKIFTEDQSRGINKYVALLAVPFLCFKIIAETDLYHLNYQFILADTASKVAVLAALAGWAVWLAPRGKPPGWAYDWAVTVFMVACLPNTLVIGVPVVGSMYGQHAGTLMAQVVVFQVRANPPPRGVGSFGTSCPQPQALFPRLRPPPPSFGLPPPP